MIVRCGHQWSWCRVSWQPFSRHTASQVTNKPQSYNGSAEPPFLFCNTPVIRSWDGWSFMNPPTHANTDKTGSGRGFIKERLRLTPRSGLYAFENNTPARSWDTLFSLSNNDLHSTSVSHDNPTPAQLSFVLLKLRDELPQFFSGHHSYDTLYHRDVILENKLMGVACTIKGRTNYRMCMSSLRHLICSINSNVNLDLMKITKDVDTGRIEARWRINGTPRYYSPWLKMKVLHEGFSIFIVDRTGQIKVHVMDEVMPLPKNKSLIQTLLSQFRSLIPKPALQTHHTTSN